MTLAIEPTALPEVAIVTPRRHGDARGFFSEVFSAAQFEAAFGPMVFLQDNHSWSAEVGVVRGLHYQVPPSAQGKLVRVAQGRILDVVVDIRRGSPRFGRHVAVELSAANWRQLWIPPGFAHGFCTLEPDCAVLYKVTAAYDAACEFGIAFDDPALGIPWPVDRDRAILSDKDRAQPTLADQPHVFP